LIEWLNLARGSHDSPPGLSRDDIGVSVGRDGWTFAAEIIDPA